MTMERADILGQIEQSATPVDRRSPLPAWAQVQRDLRRHIERFIPTGGQLPTERELSDIYRVSRITVRQALAELASDGYVDRLQGMGTFVSQRPEPIQHDFGLTTPWRDRFTAAGMNATSVQIQGDEEAEPFELTRRLEHGEAERQKIHLRRTHTVDGRAIGCTDSWVSMDVAPGLADTPLVDGSLSRTLSKNFAITEVANNHYLEVGTATSAVAELLRVPIEASLIVVWTITRLPDGRLLETSRTTWVASRVRFHYKS